MNTIKLPSEEANEVAERIAKKILAKMAKQDNFPLMQGEMVKIILEEARIAEGLECARALAFASSVIKSGEDWTDSCEDIIAGALNQYYPCKK